MKIVKADKKDIKRFIDFADKLYEGDDNYVPYMRADLKKTLKKLLFVDQTYTALLAEGDDGKVLGRVLFTIDKNKQHNTEKCGFFSMYECVDDAAVSSALIEEMIRMMKAQGADYVSGTYFPYDQDNRRGIMVKGFERAPLIFTSYNKPYYDAQLTAAGLEKDVDTLEFSIDIINDSDIERLTRIANFAMKRYHYHIEALDLNNLEQGVNDVCDIMQAATNEINYQDAPDKDTIMKTCLEWKNYLNPDVILFAKRDEDNKAIGFVLALPDFFQVFRKMRGRTDLRGLIAFLRERKKIHAFRGILQYVVPEYQKKGVIPSLYAQMYHAAEKDHYDYFEAGTILETNKDSFAPLIDSGVEISRVYRIYGKAL